MCACDMSDNKSEFSIFIQDSLKAHTCTFHQACRRLETIQVVHRVILRTLESIVYDPEGLVNLGEIFAY